MFVPRWLVFSLMVAAATVSGWILHGFATNGFSLMSDAAQPAAPAANRATPLNLSVDGGDPKPVINLTVNTPGSTVSGTAGRAMGPSRGGESSPAVIARGISTPNPVHLTVQPAAPVPGTPGYGGMGSDESFVSNDSRITVNGNNIVVASDGSIVFQGDNGSLNGNTGSSSSGGTIAIDNNGSSISTQGSDRAIATSKANTNSAPTGVSTRSRSAEPESDLHAGRPTAPAAPGSRSPADVQTAPDGQSTGNVESAAMVQAAATPAGGGLSGGAALMNVAGRSVSISGYEDHSITVDGNDQIILYDDSNVFINRDGQVNANTGDTDSSGLNVVDAQDSVVRSGNSGDGEGSGDDEEEEDEDEAPPLQAMTADQVPESDEDLFAQSFEAPRSGPPAAAVLSGQAYGSVDDEDTATTASGDDVLVIGGDGYDDLAIRSRGDRNTVVYDDSNLVIGGTGGVNAQIGDSDTGGAVVMGVRNSFIEAGCEGDLCPLYDSGYHAAAVRQTGT